MERLTRKIILQICVLILVLGFSYIFWGIIGGTSYIQSRSENTEKIQIVPDQEEQIDEDTIAYDFLLEEQETIHPCLEVFTSHQYVKAYADGQLVYTLQAEKSIFGRTAGAAYNLIEVPVGTKNVHVEMTAVYPQVRGKEYEFYLGDGISMYLEYIQNSIPETAVSGLNTILGLVMIAYWFIFRKKSGQGPTMLFFGMFTIILGLWTLNETNLVTIMFTSRGVASAIGYVLLMMMAPPFVLFVKFFTETEERLVCSLLCIWAFVNFVFCGILHITGIYEFKQTTLLTHILLVASLCYMAGCLILRIRKRGFDHLVKVNFIAALVLLISFCLDIVGYYQGAKRTDVIGRIGILIYIFLLGKESVSDFLRQIDAGRKAELYKELAITDVMTGLYNRSAFEEWENQHTDFHDMMLVTFDLNCLKACNDNMGHAAGDRYIIDAAHLIRQIFGGIGDIYRIGGDEFCAIIKKASHVKIDRYLAKLRKAQEAYNEGSEDVVMQIACGYAVYEETDSTFEDTRSRADVWMYQNKKDLKGK